MSVRLPIRCVYDCNIYLQAAINPNGPAGRCVQSAFDAKVVLFASAYILDEIADVLARPAIASRFGVSSESASRLVRAVSDTAIIVDPVPSLFEVSTDRDDSPYVNLAIETKSHYLVSRDKHLLGLLDPSHPDRASLHRLAPDLRVVTPPELLAEIESERE